MLNNHHLLLMMTTRWASSSSSASWSWRMRGWNWTTTTTTTTTTKKKKKDRVFIKQHSSSSNSMTMTHRNRLVGPQLDESTETESRRKSKPTPTKTSNNSNHDHPKSNDAHNNLSSSDRIPASKVSSNKKLIQTNFKNTSSSSSTNFNPELISSFQEPSLVGLTPPLVEQDHHPIPRSPQPPPPRSNPQSNSLTATPSNPTPEFTVLPTHAFHTHRFVTQIERSGIGLQSAKQILTHVEHSLRSSERRWLLTGPSGGIVSKSYAEGQAYLYNAALGELRTEVQVKARNDGIVLKSASNSVQREIDNLKQKLKEDIGALKNELQLEINSRKEEGSDDQKKLELSIQELNSKFTILVSEVRTEIETRKWVTTRRCVVAIASLALCVVIFTALENQSPSSGSSTASSSNLSSSSSPSSSPNPSSEEDRKPSLKDRTMRSVEELGILPEREDYETDYSTSSFFGSLSSSPKRVGE